MSTLSCLRGWKEREREKLAIGKMEVRKGYRESVDKNRRRKCAVQSCCAATCKIGVAG